VEAEKRAHLRVPVRLRVVIEHDGARTELRCRDLSLGGMFVECARTLPFGTEVTAEVSLPALPRPAAIRCVVRWVKTDGMGLAFGSLRAAETWAINEVVADRSRG